MTKKRSPPAAAECPADPLEQVPDEQLGMVLNMASASPKVRRLGFLVLKSDEADKLVAEVRDLQAILVQLGRRQEEAERKRNRGRPPDETRRKWLATAIVLHDYVGMDWKDVAQRMKQDHNWQVGWRSLYQMACTARKKDPRVRRVIDAYDRLLALHPPPGETH